MHWVGFALAILAGVILYWCRCRHRFWYGVGEILVALLLLYIFFSGGLGVIVSSWTGSGAAWRTRGVLAQRAPGLQISRPPMLNSGASDGSSAWT